MALITNQGLNDITQLVLGITGAVSYELRLYTNALPVTVTVVLADLVECTLAGYAPITLNPVNWGGATTAGLANYTYIMQTFTFNPYAGGVTITGYHVVNTVQNHLCLLENFTTPYPVPAGGGSINITLNLLDTNF